MVVGFSQSFVEPAELFQGGFSLTTNSEMVDHLTYHKVIKSVEVAIVMEIMDRGSFVPEHSPSYINRCLPIGFEAAISAPYEHAICLELLKDHLKPGMHALDVGSGSGYMTACFADMVEPHGFAVGVEIIPELVDISIQNIGNSRAAPLLEKGSLLVIFSDGMDGWWEFAPYDAIHVGFFAPEIIPPLIEQLKPGGRLVIPFADDASPILRVIDMKSDGTISERIENPFDLEAMIIEQIMSITRTVEMLCHRTQFKQPEMYPGGHSIGTKNDMLNYLIKNRLILSLEVAKVMDKIDRALFVCKGSPPYVDCHQPIGYGSSIFAPNQTAVYLGFLHGKLKPGMHALDIGSGSGYLTACFAVLVGRNGRAVGVEKVPELVDFSYKNIGKSKAAPLLRQGSLSLHVGDGMQGWAEFAPYDAISVGFVVPEIYPALTEQLKQGGRLVIPVEEGASVIYTIIEKKSDGTTVVVSRCI